MQENPTEPCIFCPSFDSHTVLENDDAYARWDGYPVTQHHLLIIPKRHAGGKLRTPIVSGKVEN